jgi:hypothetical protein
VRLDVLHGVVDRETRRNHAARGVDVEGDVLLRVLGLQEQHLRDDEVGDRVVDGLAEKDDVVLEEAGIDVVSPLPAGRLLDDHWNQDHAASLFHNRSLFP